MWLIVLDFMERLMQSGGEKDQLFEAIPESLKNLVLVMNASNTLLPPPLQAHSELTLLWTETRNRLERFLPGFLDELVPTPSPSEEENDVTPEDNPAAQADT